jgi:translation initiation factor IF-2
MAITKPKKKLTDLAKELGLPVQDIVDFYTNEMKVEKKSSASAEISDVNLIIEYFSQKNAVTDFDAYFAMRGQKPAATGKKPEQDKNILKSIKQIIPKAKPPAKAAQKTPKADVKPTAPKAEKQPKPAQQPRPETAPARPDTSRPAVNNTANTAPAKSALVPNTNRKPTETKPTVSKSDQFKERFNARDVLDRAKKQEKQDKTAVKKADSNQVRKQQTIVGNIADASTVDQKIHNVDTRGTYVEIDKYNERYDNIAPTSIGGKKQDSFKSKQKITQKSVQRKNQQYSSKQETEAQKMRRLELERARKQQIKVLIPDEIVVSELALRLKMTAPTVIKQLMKLGEMKTINDVLDYDTAALVAEELGAKV